MDRKHEIPLIETLKATKKTAKIKKLVVISFILVVISVLPSVARAATLDFSPSSGSWTIGNAFSASVYVSSADKALNAVSVLVSFPQDKLEVTSLSKSGSIMNLWVQEPSFSNAAGTITAEGIVLKSGLYRRRRKGHYN